MTLLVLEGDLLKALSAHLGWTESICCVSTTLQSARRKLVEHSPSVVVTGITLPDGTWCDLLRWIEEHNSDIRLLVARRRSGAVLLGDVIRRGGYFALPPLQEWFSAGGINGDAGR